MQVIVIAELIYASYTDIRCMEVEPGFIIFCIFAKIVELIVKEQPVMEVLFISSMVFLILLGECLFFSMGGADALIGLLICVNLGLYGILAILTGMLLAIPLMAARKGKETPLIPFMSAGYLIWLFVIG